MLLSVFLLLSTVTIYTNQESEQLEKNIFSYDDIQDLMKHMVKMYENPSITTQSLFRDAAVIYLNKLHSLETAVKGGLPKAKSIIQEVYNKGLHLQLKSAPFSMLVGHYGWNHLECKEYEDIVFKANDIWRYFLKDVIHEKEPSLPEEHRVFTFDYTK